MKLSSQIFTLTAVLSLSSCSSHKVQTGVPDSQRQPASMKWEFETPKEEMSESTAKWYMDSILKQTKATGDSYLKVANLIAQAKVRGATCSIGDFYYSDLLDSYMKAITVNPKAKFDKDVEKILGQSLTYRVAEKVRKDLESSYLKNDYLMEYFESRPLSPEELDGVYFESMAAGAYGSTFNIVLNKDGSFDFSRLHLDDAAENGFRWENGKGVWKLKTYDYAVRGRETKPIPEDKKEWEKRGAVFYLDFDGNNKFPKAYRVRFKRGEFHLQTRDQDLSRDQYEQSSFVSSVTGECDA